MIQLVQYIYADKRSILTDWSINLRSYLKLAIFGFCWFASLLLTDIFVSIKEKKFKFKFQWCKVSTSVIIQSPRAHRNTGCGFPYILSGCFQALCHLIGFKWALMSHKAFIRRDQSNLPCSSINAATRNITPTQSLSNIDIVHHNYIVIIPSSPLINGNSHVHPNSLIFKIMDFA